MNMLNLFAHYSLGLGSLLASSLFGGGLVTSPVDPLSTGAQPGLHGAFKRVVTIVLENGSTQTAEANAGGGYLSQSTSFLTFGLGEKKVRDIRIRWPDGSLSVAKVSVDQSNLTIKQPD